MALQTTSLWMPEPAVVTGTLTSLVIDATGEMVAWCGHVWNKDGTTKNITKAGFRFAAVTKAGGSALTVSLQNVLLSAGPTMRPDETPAETVAIANANAAFVTNTWLMTDAFSAPRAAAFGSLLAIVSEFDGAGRLGADSVGFSAMTNVGAIERKHRAVFSTKTGGTWSSAHQPNIILEFDDGTFGTLFGAVPYTAVPPIAYKQDTGTADEYALSFTVPFSCKVDGFWALMAFAAGTSDFDVVLYDGTTAMTNGTASYDANAMVTAGAAVLEGLFAAPITLAAGTTYRLAFKPTQTTSTISLYCRDVAAAGHLQALAGGTSWNLDSRLDLGAWIGSVTTRQPFAGIHISALDDGVSAGGGIGLSIPNIGS